MKTSNIILLAVFATILIWILVSFITVKAKITKFIDEHPEVITKKNETVKKETLKLDPFNTVVVSGEGDLYINHSNSNELQYAENQEYNTNVTNDTLFIDIKGQKCTLSVNDMQNIITKDKAWVKISDLKADTFVVVTKDDSRLKLYDLSCSYLTINSTNKSKITLKDVNKKGTEAKFKLNDASIIKIDDSEGMSLSVQKDSDAKFEDD